ncbi:hypothetical protein [Pelagicoccus sp. SDUM812005]|nr:hypothetical protein [Pelagicoccus sp. SDUM812005]MDQ8180770.1 hypothetical protein [Pelagicoccus sp. SDUM812005]
MNVTLISVGAIAIATLLLPLAARKATYRSERSLLALAILTFLYAAYGS